jgi:hypothetical protein
MSSLVEEILRAHADVAEGKAGARAQLHRLQAQFRTSGQIIERSPAGATATLIEPGGGGGTISRMVKPATKGREPIELRLRGHSPFTIDLSPGSKTAILDEIRSVRRHGDLEAAGFLFAPKRPSFRSDSVLICVATHAGDDTRHSQRSVALGDPYEVQASLPPELAHVMRIGDWHSHGVPESDVPSDVDLRAWAANLDAMGLPFYTGIIASPARDGGWMLPSLTPWCVRREGYPSKLVCERAQFRW